jgi:hypothetical protein
MKKNDIRLRTSVRVRIGSADKQLRNTNAVKRGKGDEREIREAA